jgi:hypothetical protein
MVTLIPMRIIRLRYPPALLILSLFFSSCATILNKPLQQIAITPGPGLEILSVDKGRLADHPLIGSSDARVYVVPRSRKPLEVHVRADTSYKTVVLKPRHSVAYWSNIYFNDGIGLLVDRKTPKRFGYRTHHYLEARGSTVRSLRFAPVPGGTLSISLFYPYATMYRIRSAHGTYNSTGVLGAGAGINYYYADDRYLSFELGAASDLFGEYFGTGYIESANTLFGSLRANRRIGSFDFGYGASMSRLRWANRTIGDTVNMDQTLTSVAAGFSLSAQYRLGNYLRAGVLYQPAIWQGRFRPAFAYQHCIFLQLILQVPF